MAKTLLLKNAAELVTCRGNAPKEGTSPLTLSNRNTFITPDAPYSSAPTPCRIHNTICNLPPLVCASA